MRPLMSAWRARFALSFRVAIPDCFWTRDDATALPKVPSLAERLDRKHWDRQEW